MSNEIGLIKGETCNRDGCVGIINEHEKEGSCSCHINPPCSYCTTDTAYCPVCDWQASDEVIPVDLESQKRNQEYYKEQNERFQAARELFYKKYHSGKDIDKLEMRTESHTHFTQKVFGIFPIGTETMASILPKVNGTFGGRYIRFTDYSFEFIAQTD